MTSLGGELIIDSAVHSLWQAASESDLTSIIKKYPSYGNPLTRILASLACLLEAGLLERKGYKKPETFQAKLPSGELVSVIIVSFDSLEWLKVCLPSLFDQRYTPLETIIIDNASKDDSAGWVRANYPYIQFTQLEQSTSLASALNLGISQASGRYYLLLNPDVKLEDGAIAHMVAAAQKNPNCAAVAAKLKFMWAPAFLNGLGNFVGAFTWGTDCALGHLDLGQFDHWEQVPSACFAAALITAAAWKEVGILDEGFPMYYEDSEWCYRARLFGYSVLAAPEAVFYHAFSGRTPSRESEQISALKLRRVAYGRLRFASRLLGPAYLVRFLAGYFLEDNVRIGLAVVRGRWQHAAAHIRAWNDFRRDLPGVRKDRRLIQKRRKISDRVLFAAQRHIPAPLIRDGNPLLTTDLIENEYLPLIALGKTKPLPEFSLPIPEGTWLQENYRRKPWIKRFFGIWRHEGLSAAMHRLARTIEWRLMQP